MEVGETKNSVHAVLLYDGECPFCSRYVRMSTLKKNIQLELVDARVSTPELKSALAAGYDLNEGFLLHMEGVYYHGEQAIHALALLSSRSNAFNKANAWIFSSPRLSRWLYPVLKTFRNLTLKLIGAKPLSLD